MKKLLLTSLLVASAIFGHTTEPAGPPPSDVAPAIAATLQKDGVRVLDGKKVVMELWFVAAAPTGPKTTEEAVSWETVATGAFLGVARFPERGSDRRGMTIKPGLYTMRFALYPQNGNHQGVEPQRDFLVLSLAADDKDPKSTPNFDTLMEMSRKAAGNPHPAVMSFWRAEADAKPGVEAKESDQVLTTKIGDVPISVIVAGRNAH
ncbi:MAG TPA: hypothetical protein VER03_24260 [Bryobacteraceae bacterium]|nr:hypothetical protein [Bryobacteraceae bacterium]